MGISSLLLRVGRALCPDWPKAEDAVLDDLIREALLEEMLATPPARAWERLFHAVSDGAARRRGMWVLEEVPRGARRAAWEQRSVEIERQTYLPRQAQVDQWWQVREAIWGNMFPTYAALLNW